MAASNRSRSITLALTPPATTSRLAPVCSMARRHLITRVSTAASWNARAMSQRSCSLSAATPPRSLMVFRVKVLSPEKLMSRPGRSVIGRGKRNRPAVPLSASFARRGPPG